MRFISKLVAVAGMGLPPFWLALVLQLIFYAQLGWLPVGGRVHPSIQAPAPITGLLTLDALLTWDTAVLSSAGIHLLLPAATLAANRVGQTMRFVRSAMLEVMRQDYIRTARAKGLSERVVIYRHALRNALISVATITGLQFGWLLGGTVYVESVFSWPGLGRYAFESIWSFDYMPVMAVTLLIAFIFTIVNLVVDIMYGVLDPRIRYE